MLQLPPKKISRRKLHRIQIVHYSVGDRYENRQIYIYVGEKKNFDNFYHFFGLVEELGRRVYFNDPGDICVDIFDIFDSPKQYYSGPYKNHQLSEAEFWEFVSSKEGDFPIRLDILRRQGKVISAEKVGDSSLLTVFIAEFETTYCYIFYDMDQ